jgi:dCMP deaminase
MLLSKSEYYDMLLYQMRILEDKSTCAAKKVACIIFDNKDSYDIPSYEDDFNKKYSIYTGYNKSVTNCKCCDLFYKDKEKNLWYTIAEDGSLTIDNTGRRHGRWSSLHEVHAEIAALTEYNKSIRFVNPSALISYSPCVDCCKSLINAGIKNIFYFEVYDNVSSVRTLCKEAGIIFRKISIVNGKMT